MDILDQLVRGEYPDPDAGGATTLDVRVRTVAIRDSLAGEEAELVAALALGDSLAVVSDAGTHAVLGARLERALASRFDVRRVDLGPRAEPEETVVASLVAELRANTDALVAVGTGAINDLCKAVAAQLGRPYVVFPTAPSVNGYASATSSISTTSGFKQSLKAPPPVGVFCDLDVLAKAPKRLIYSGLGESLDRCTAQADWLLAHRLVGTPYRRAPFEILLTVEDELFAAAEALAAGDRAAMELLMRSLVLAGMGMTIAGGSISCSQAEHLISHYIDMMHPAGVPPAYHGEQIAVATVIMAALQERVLSLDAAPVLEPTPVTRDEVIAHFGEASGEHAWQELERKLLTPARARELSDKLAAEWSAIRDEIRAVTRPAAELRAVCQRAGAPSAPADLGWSDELARTACYRARQLRNRFTFLDLAIDARIEPIA